MKTLPEVRFNLIVIMSEVTANTSSK